MRSMLVTYTYYHLPLSLTWLRYIEYLIGTNETAFPDQEFPTIQALCMAVLEHFSAKNLRLCIQGKLSTAGKARPLEAQNQDEFYRAFNAVVPCGVPVSSEWSHHGDGRIDFWIPQKKWGVELLRDHDRVDEHCNRFKKGGRYYPWIKAGMLEDWIIIDCATSLPTSGMRSRFVNALVWTTVVSQLCVLKLQGGFIKNDLFRQERKMSKAY
jgi:hypothetical protein